MPTKPALAPFQFSSVPEGVTKALSHAENIYKGLAGLDHGAKAVIVGKLIVLLHQDGVPKEDRKRLLAALFSAALTDLTHEDRLS